MVVVRRIDSTDHADAPLIDFDRRQNSDNDREKQLIDDELTGAPWPQDRSKRLFRVSTHIDNCNLFVRAD